MLETSVRLFWLGLGVFVQVWFRRHPDTEERTLGLPHLQLPPVALL